MFIHVVMMRFTPEADEAMHRVVHGFAERIRSEADGLFDYRFGRNVADRAKGFDWSVIGMFRSSRDHDGYQASKAHQEMKAFMSPFISDLVVCDFDTNAAAGSAGGANGDR